MNSVYLDYAATTPLLPAVKIAMSKVAERLEAAKLGNPSALHTPGQVSKEIIEEARLSVAELIGAEPEEIIFTSGGSEANNTVAHIFAGQNIAASAIEHPSMLESARAYASQLTLIPVDEFGFIDPTKIPKDQALISIMLANNELGTLVCANSDPATAGVAQRPPKSPSDKAAYLHTDATQAVGKIPINVKALGVDYLTLSAHKIGGPVGIGALYVKSGAPFKPLIYGGHQENGRRAGTSNVMLAAGFGAAALEAKRRLPEYAQVAKLRDQLKARILAAVPYSSCNTPEKNCLPHILNLSFQAAEGESIQLYLDAAGIIVSTGSACASSSLEPSHVLMATRHDAETAHSSIRFSLAPETTQADIDRVMSELPGIIKRLQGISTVKIKEAK